MGLKQQPGGGRIEAELQSFLLSFPHGEGLSLPAPRSAERSAPAPTHPASRGADQTTRPKADKNVRAPLRRSVFVETQFKE